MKLADRFGKITIGDKEYLLVEEVVLESMLKENILNRDAVMDIFAKFEGEALAYRQHGKETFPIAEKYTDIICSLSLPVLSEEEIDVLKEMLQEYRRMYAHGGMNRGQTDMVSGRMDALEAAIKELTKPKEEP